MTIDRHEKKKYTSLLNKYTNYFAQNLKVLLDFSRTCSERFYDDLIYFHL